MKIGNQVAHFLCDRTLQKWLNFKLSNTHAWGVDLSPPFIDARTFPQKSLSRPKLKKYK